jgi:cytochrome c
MKFWKGAGLWVGSVLAMAAIADTQQPLTDKSWASVDTRPLSPWVFRSVLDGQPRVVTVALHSNLYIAYNAAGASLFKAWKGGVEFDGAVYTTRHGPQPTSTGYAFYEQANDAPAWLIKQGETTEAAQVQFGGYRFEKNQVIFQYTLTTVSGAAIQVQEVPEYTARNNQTGLQRRFTLHNVPDNTQVGLATRLTSLANANDFSTTGQFVETARHEVNHQAGNTLTIDGQLWLDAQQPTELTVYFHPGFADADTRPAEARVPQDDVARGKQLIAGSDCQACHNEERKTVGPAYKEIAERYDTGATTRANLISKIIEGGRGAWGEIPMSPHPDLMPDDAGLMVSYIFSLKTPGEVTEADPLFLGVASRALEINDQPKTPASKDQLKPGLAVAAFHIEDFATQTFSQVVLSGAAPVVHAHELEDLGAIATNVRMLFNGFINVEKADDYTLRLITDDGGRMRINDEPVVDRWQNQGPTPTDVKVALKKGLNTIEIDYFQALAGGSISLQWIEPGGSQFSVIPQANLRHYAHQVVEPIPYIPRRELVKSIPGDKNKLQSVHPAFTLTSARPSWFKPMVGGMDFFRDGRLALCTWDKEGSVYILDGVHDRAPEDIAVTRIATGLGECLGLKIVDGEMYVMQKHELTHLVDKNGDDVIDEYRTVSDQWQVSANFHEFAFGLEYQDGYFYGALATAIEPGGASTNPQIPDRGKVIKISRNDGSVEFIAHGLRTPNGIGKGVNKELFIADNQGDWLPASKIVHVQQGAFYGSRSVDFAGTKNLKETLPVVWLPQDEIGNSPSQPIYIDRGDYKGQMLHGEVTHGGLKRVFVEKVNGKYQGAVFRFSQGLEAGVNRVVWSPDGKSLFIGGVGNPGNWADQGKNWFGLEKLTFNNQQAFEMQQVSARSNGMEITFTQPIEEGRGITASEYDVQQWYYQPTADYGGEKLDLRPLKILSVNVSRDRKKVFLELDGMKPGHMVYLRIAEPFVSSKGQSLWSTEAWYTLNEIPDNKAGFKRVVQQQSDNTLSAAERKAGWKLLFDGKTLNGWRNYCADTIGSAWKVVDGKIHLDPSEIDGWQTVGGGDIITEDQYENYELTLDWKVAPGGNSGLIYGVVEGADYPYTWHTGTEYQLLDNPAHPDGVIKTHRAGDLYDFIASEFVAVNDGGEWNSTRLVVNRGKVEHWLNGYKVVEYDRNSSAWQEMIANSKFRDMPGFAKSARGHIALQDHSDKVWFKNIRIRELK